MNSASLLIFFLCYLSFLFQLFYPPFSSGGEGGMQTAIVGYTLYHNGVPSHTPQNTSFSMVPQITIILEWTKELEKSKKSIIFGWRRAWRKAWELVYLNQREGFSFNFRNNKKFTSNLYIDMQKLQKNPLKLCQP